MDDELLVLDRVGTPPNDGVGAPIPASELFSEPEGSVLSDAPPPARAAAEEPAAQQPAVLPAVHPAADDAPADLSTAKIVEALLFSSDTPLSCARLAELAGGCTPTQVRQAVGQLNEKYAAGGLSFRIEAIARGYQMLTLADYQPWLAKLNQHRSQSRLSRAALEALSIVAYRQPIIRSDIEAIRGVACGDLLNRLRELGLVRIAGRAEVVGRPLLYATTRKFLDVFGLADLDDLPPLEALNLRRRTPAEPEVPAEEPEPAPPVAVSA